MGNIDGEEYSRIREIDTYLQPHVIMKDRLIRRLVDIAKLPIDAQFIDVGCGRGRICKMLADRGFQGKGIDLEDVCVQFSRKRLRAYNRVHIAKGDLNCIHSQYDLVIMSSVLEHILDDRKAISGVYRILKDRGYFLFTVPGDKRLFGDQDIAHGHYRRYEKDEIIEKLDGAGFHIVKIWAYGMAWISKLYRFMIRHDLAAHNVIDEYTNTTQSAIDPIGFNLVKKLYPIYSKLYFLYNVQLLFLNYNFFRANYAGLAQKPSI